MLLPTRPIYQREFLPSRLDKKPWAIPSAVPLQLAAMLFLFSDRFIHRHDRESRREPPRGYRTV